MADGLIMWITGRSGSGKSTLARGLEEDLLERGLDVETLDADQIRGRWLPTLGSSQEEKAGYLGLIGHFCRRLSRNGVIAIAAAASASREMVAGIRHDSGRFVEIYLECPEDVAEERRRAASSSESEWEARGLFEGGSPPPGPANPSEPELVLETDKASPEQCRQQVLRAMEMLRLIPELELSEYSEEEDDAITRRLKDLGYL